jgi:hypothetical protein
MRWTVCAQIMRCVRLLEKDVECRRDGGGEWGTLYRTSGQRSKLRKELARALPSVLGGQSRMEMSRIS